MYVDHSPPGSYVKELEAKFIGGDLCQKKYLALQTSINVHPRLYFYSFQVRGFKSLEKVNGNWKVVRKLSRVTSKIIFLTIQIFFGKGLPLHNYPLDMCVKKIHQQQDSSSSSSSGVGSLKKSLLSKKSIVPLLVVVFASL